MCAWHQLLNLAKNASYGRIGCIQLSVVHYPPGLVQRFRLSLSLQDVQLRHPSTVSSFVVFFFFLKKLSLKMLSETVRRACGQLAKVQTTRCAGSPLKMRAPIRPERLEEPGQYGWWPVSTTALQNHSCQKQLISTKSPCRSVRSTNH